MYHLRLITSAARATHGSSLQVGGEQGAGGALVEGIERLHVVLVEGKVEDGGVLLDAVRGAALGQRDPVLLQTVADQDLGG